MLWLKLRYRLALYYRSLLFNLGLGKILLKNRPGACLVVFHGVDIKGAVDLNSRFVSREYLERFIKYIASNFNVISVADFYAEKFEKDTFNLALTFDDGYLNNFKYVIPLLEAYHLPASFYITTIHTQKNFLWPDFLDLVTNATKRKTIEFEGKTYQKKRKSEFEHKGQTLKSRCKELPYSQISELYRLFAEDWKQLQGTYSEDYWKLMTIEQIRQIAAHPLFSIGCHGHTHANLVAINFRDAQHEIRQSKSWLEKICGREIEEFAFPFGYYNMGLVEYCESLGFNKILLVDYNERLDASNEAMKERIVINPHLALEHQIACILKGSYY
jgi:peptidoglycan/xylan/chitin deacetylase (PgdA/CDA1 family)